MPARKNRMGVNGDPIEIAAGPAADFELLFGYCTEHSYQLTGRLDW